MAFIALGKVAPSLVIPDPILLNRADLVNKHVIVNTVYFQVDPQNSGDIDIGGLAFHNTPGNANNIYVTLRPPTANHLPDLAVSIPGCPNPFDLDDLFVLAHNQGDTVHIFALQW